MDERRAVKEAYNEMAEDYTEYVTSGSASDRPDPVKQFQNELTPEYDLLDAGCGPGRPTLRMSGKNGVGLDISREQLSLATERVTADLVQGDMTALPFTSDSFDAVIALYSLIHVPVDDHQTVLKEFARVLRPGGPLLVSEGGVEWTGSNPDWLDSGVEMRWSMAGPEATQNDLQACGFEIREVWNAPDPTTDDEVKPFFLATLP